MLPTTFIRSFTIAAVLAGVCSAAVASPLPSYATGEESIKGTISSVSGKYKILVHDDRGFIDDVTLHDGTIINPTGLTLGPGQSVTILGHNAGSSFSANEIDTPYETRSSVTYAYPYLLDEAYQGVPYGYGYGYPGPYPYYPAAYGSVGIFFGSGYYGHGYYGGRGYYGHRDDYGHDGYYGHGGYYGRGGYYGNGGHGGGYYGRGGYAGRGGGVQRAYGRSVGGGNVRAGGGRGYR